MRSGCRWGRGNEAAGLDRARNCRARVLPDASRWFPSPQTSRARATRKGCHAGAQACSEYRGAPGMANGDKPQRQGLLQVQALLVAEKKRSRPSRPADSWLQKMSYSQLGRLGTRRKSSLLTLFF